MDPNSSPEIIPNNSLHNPFPHSLLRTRQPTSALGCVDSLLAVPRMYKKRLSADTVSHNAVISAFEKATIPSPGLDVRIYHIYIYISILADLFHTICVYVHIYVHTY